ncbi:MAG: two-component regulator propeller domain-containing protein [candidate division KSB1 bacterium]|nr:two-component regulator propeller domain-containing protein [candidate division KSB1 bacterium]
MNKYDGYEFNVFQPEPENPHGISANLIRCITQDRNGFIWIGTEAGGLNRYDPKMNSFKQFNAESTLQNSLCGNDVNSILEDSSGVLWIGTENGLNRLDPATNECICYPLHKSKSGIFNSNEILTLFEDNHHTLWIGTSFFGLAEFDKAQEQFRFHTHDENNDHSIGDNEVWAIHEDSQGQMWIGTKNGGLNYFNRKEGKFTKHFPGAQNPESTTIRAILEDDDGNLWIGNRSGLYLFDKVKKTFTFYSHEPNNPYSLVQNSVWAIFKDRKGDLWIGTRGGISFLNTTNRPFVHYRSDANNNRYLNSQFVYAILEDRRGNLWFGTEHGGVNHLNRKTGEYTYFTYDKNNRNSLSLNNVKAILEDIAGNLWIGTFNGGLNVLNPESARFTHYMHNEKNPAGLADNRIKALLEDDQGYIWIGTYESGLDRYDPATGKFTHILEQWHHEGFNFIHCLIQDQYGSIWMGANLSKVGCIDTRTGEFTYYSLNSSVKNLEVMTAFEDSRGNLWFGTVGGGLFLFNREQRNFISFTKKDGLPSNIIHGILEDDTANLWISTTNGLCRFNIENKTTKNYYDENGLQSDQFNYNAQCKARDGELFFGGINGVTAFYPDRIQGNTYIPPVVISDFRILNKPVVIGGEDSLLKQSISSTREIALSHKHTVFSFEFVALNYAISEQNQYAYQLEGFEETWNYVGNRRYATYTNLDPGEYTFRVKAANNDNVWNEQGASIQITISAPFHRTVWFKLIVILLMLLIFAHLLNYIRQKRNLLKAKSLANLAQLKLLRNQMNPHFLFNALSSIRSMIIIDREQAWKMISELSEFFRYSMQTYNRIETELRNEIEAVKNYVSIEKIRFRDSLDVAMHIDESAMSCVLPGFTLQPLVENAIKHGLETCPLPLKIRINISYYDGILSVDISNTGSIVNSPSRKRNPSDIHGTAIHNIRKRLSLMFENSFSLGLTEEDGCVHAKLRIDYNKKRIQPLKSI